MCAGFKWSKEIIYSFPSTISGVNIRRGPSYGRCRKPRRPSWRMKTNFALSRELGVRGWKGRGAMWGQGQILKECLERAIEGIWRFKIWVAKSPDTVNVSPHTSSAVETSRCFFIYNSEAQKNPWDLVWAVRALEASFKRCL